METMIIATNMSDQPQKFLIDMQNLLPTFKKAYPNNTVVMVKTIISGESVAVVRSAMPMGNGCTFLAGPIAK